MEWVKLFLENYVEIIHYIAWPAVIILCLFLFRIELAHLIGRVKVYRFGDNYIEFSDKDQQGGASKLPEWETKKEFQEHFELSDEATKILATIWQRQKHHFKEDFTRRWSFRILPNTEVYGIFILGFAELLKLGLIEWTRKDGQALLSNKGIDYLKNHPQIQNSNNVYNF